MIQKKAPPSPSSQTVTMLPLSRNRKILSRVSAAQTGQKIGNGADIHGGGGPENMGARSSESPKAIPFYQNQPSWDHEALQRNEYIGYAAPSTTPNMAGIPANNFRFLGDNHGGRG